MTSACVCLGLFRLCGVQFASVQGPGLQPVHVVPPPANIVLQKQHNICAEMGQTVSEDATVSRVDFQQLLQKAVVITLRQRQAAGKYIPDFLELTWKWDSASCGKNLMGDKRSMTPFGFTVSCAINVQSPEAFYRVVLANRGDDVEGIMTALGPSLLKEIRELKDVSVDYEVDGDKVTTIFPIKQTCATDLKALESMVNVTCGSATHTCLSCTMPRDQFGKTLLDKARQDEARDVHHRRTLHLQNVLAHCIEGAECPACKQKVTAAMVVYARQLLRGEDKTARDAFVLKHWGVHPGYVSPLGLGPEQYVNSAHIFTHTRDWELWHFFGMCESF
jgi:hypothetical protein